MTIGVYNIPILVIKEKLLGHPAPRKDVIILQLYWWLFSSTKHSSQNMVQYMVNLQSYFPSCKIALHTMTVKLHYKLHLKLLPVICTVK